MILLNLFSSIFVVVCEVDIVSSKTRGTHNYILLNCITRNQSSENKVVSLSSVSDVCIELWKNYCENFNLFCLKISKRRKDFLHLVICSCCVRKGEHAEQRKRVRSRRHTFAWIRIRFDSSHSAYGLFSYGKLK